jgi:type III secretory pathway component EscV
MVTPGTERVVRRYLDTFLGFQEVADMLREWWLDARDEERARRGDLIGHSAEDRARLVQVLQRLVRQRVPLLRLGPILETFQSTPVDGRRLHDLLDRVRLTLHDELPGSAGRGTPVFIGEGWERRIRGWVSGPDGTRFLAVTADQEPALYSFLGRVADLQGQDAVLVVQDGTLQRFVQQLIEGRFADVSVISQAELGNTGPQSPGPALAAPEPSGVPA